ncbi:hypothetical protein Tco_1156968 [Tanacetum coccineum]
MMMKWTMKRGNNAMAGVGDENRIPEEKWHEIRSVREQDRVNLDRAVEMTKYNTIEVVAVGLRNVTGQEYMPDFGKLNHSGPGGFEHWARRVPGTAESYSSLGEPTKGWIVYVRDETWFFESEGGWGGRGVKEKHNGLDNITVKYNVNVMSYVTKNSGSNDVNTHTVNMEKLSEPNMGAHINDTVNVEVSATSNSTLITSALIPEFVLFATKLKGDMTRKSVNFRTLIVPTGNGTDVAISLESIQAISELFANTAYG